LNALATELGVGLGKIAQPLRVAVTGSAVSPPIDVTLALLGRERTLARLDAGIGRCRGG
jgi:glutamyl-tRNA synthetase